MCAHTLPLHARWEPSTQQTYLKGSTIIVQRIIDHVPLKIEHCLHHALVERLSVGLLQRLMADITSTGNLLDRMRELVSEDPETARKRTRLEATRTRLQEIKRRLVNFAA